MVGASRAPFGPLGRGLFDWIGGSEKSPRPRFASEDFSFYRSDASGTARGCLRRIEFTVIVVVLSLFQFLRYLPVGRFPAACGRNELGLFRRLLKVGETGLVYFEIVEELLIVELAWWGLGFVPAGVECPLSMTCWWARLGVPELLKLVPFDSAFVSAGVAFPESWFPIERLACANYWSRCLLCLVNWIWL